jgi:hypothetical protein
MSTRHPILTANEWTFGPAARVRATRTPTLAPGQPSLGRDRRWTFLRIVLILSPAAGRLTMVVSERGGEGVRGGVAGAAGYREMLQILTETIASGRGSRPNGGVER